jgi:hypothetical protein
MIFIGVKILLALFCFSTPKAQAVLNLWNRKGSALSILDFGLKCRIGEFISPSRHGGSMKPALHQTDPLPFTGFTGRWS